MKRTSIITIILVVAILSICYILYFSIFGDYVSGKEFYQLQEKNTKLEDQNSILVSENDILKSENSKIENEKVALESKNSNLENDVKKISAELKSTKNELSSEKKRVQKLKMQNNAYGDDDLLLSELFWSDGTLYVCSDPNVKFYPDITCDPDSKIKENLTFVNHFFYEIERANGIHVFISKSVEKGIVFSTSIPYFNKLEN